MFRRGPYHPAAGWTRRGAGGPVMSQTSAKPIAAIVTAASFGFVVVQLDVTIVNVALPAIATSLKAGIAELQWVVDAYALVFAVLLLSAGVIGDRYGSRRGHLVWFWLVALAAVGLGLCRQC